MRPQRRPLFPRRPGRPASVKTPLRLLVTLGAVVALTAACNPFGASSRERLPEDPRFAEFTFDSDNKPKVQERTDSFNERWPGLQATEGHVTIEYSPSDPFPNPDPEFWLTGVATVRATGLSLLHHRPKTRRQDPQGQQHSGQQGLRSSTRQSTCSVKRLSPRRDHRHRAQRLTAAHNQ